MSETTDYAALLAAGTPTPWHFPDLGGEEEVAQVGLVTISAWETNGDEAAESAADAALIVAAVNGLASGDLVPRADMAALVGAAKEMCVGCVHAGEREAAWCADHMADCGPVRAAIARIEARHE